MPIYKVEGHTEELTGDILDSIVEEVKLIDSFQYMIPERRIFLFKAYFKGLTDGLSIASKGLLMQEKIKDPIIRIIEDDIIGGLISGRLNDRQAWDTITKEISGLTHK